MSAPEFIARESLKVPKSMLNGIPHRLSFDGGASLTKIVFVKEADKENFSLELLLLHKDQFAGVLRWIKTNGCELKCDGTDVVKMTGVNSAHAQTVKEIFNANCEHVIELLTQIRGCHWLIEGLGGEAAFESKTQPEPEYTQEIDNELMAKLVEKMTTKGTSAKFPALLVHLGSGTMISAISGTGAIDNFHFSMFSGKSLQGIAMLMLGTNNFNEIFSLAERGSRAGVDLLVSEVIGDDPTSPYGQFPPNLPMFHFGKAADGKVGSGDFKKEDAARSLIALMCANLLAQVNSICLTSGISQVYFGGNFFRYKLARVEFENIKALLLRGAGFEHHYVRGGGHMGAIGALVSSNADAATYLKM